MVDKSGCYRLLFWLIEKQMAVRRSGEQRDRNCLISERERIQRGSIIQRMCSVIRHALDVVHSQERGWGGGSNIPQSVGGGSGFRVGFGGEGSAWEEASDGYKKRPVFLFQVIKMLCISCQCRSSKPKAAYQNDNFLIKFFNPLYLD